MPHQYVPRMIIREWLDFQLQDPSHMTAEDIHKVLSYPGFDQRIFIQLKPGF